jgi:hypothetical protein
MLSREREEEQAERPSPIHVDGRSGSDTKPSSARTHDELGTCARGWPPSCARATSFEGSLEHPGRKTDVLRPIDHPCVAEATPRGSGETLRSVDVAACCCLASEEEIELSAVDVDSRREEWSIDPGNQRLCPIELRHGFARTAFQALEYSKAGTKQTFDVAKAA